MSAITYIGHATALIESGGRAVLTDPNFSSRVLCIRRAEPMNYDPGKLPELSAVVISHAHHDHLDINSFKYIKGNVPVFVPVGLGKFVGKFVRNPVIELNHWATHKLPVGVEVTAVEAKHTGFRWTGLRYRNCNGYLIDIGGTKVFFAGDTAYGGHFKEVGRLYGSTSPIDAAMLPIGAYKPEWLMKKRHLNPAQAIDAFIDTGARMMVPIHYGHFRLSAEALKEPLNLLERAAKERNMIDRVHILSSGQKVDLA